MGGVHSNLSSMQCHEGLRSRKKQGGLIEVEMQQMGLGVLDKISRAWAQHCLKLLGIVPVSVRRCPQQSIQCCEGLRSRKKQEG